MHYICLYLLVVLSTPSVLCQLGCPMYGCLPGGIFSQADITVKDTPAVLWKTSVGQVKSNRTTGCLGNDNIILCPAEFSDDKRGYSSLHFQDGVILWNHTQLKDPSLPIINDAGGLIGTDGYYMVNLMPNGTEVGKAINMTNGWMRPPTNLLYMDDIEQFFMVSKSHGGLFLFGEDGVCTAAYYLLAKKYDYDHPWMPLSQPVIDGHTIYMLAHLNSNTSQNISVKLFKVNVNLQPPYLQEMWNTTVFNGTLAEAEQAQLMAMESSVFMGLPNSFLVIKDNGSNSSLTKNDSSQGYKHFAAYSDGSNMEDRQQNPPGFWAVTSDGGAIHQMDQYGNVTFTTDINKLMGASSAKITSQLAVFGYQPTEQTLVFGVTISKSEGQYSTAGSYLVAARPSGQSTLTMTWVRLIMEGADYSVQGYILGVRDTQLVGYVANTEQVTGGKGWVFSVATE